MSSPSTKCSRHYGCQAFSTCIALPSQQSTPAPAKSAMPCAYYPQCSFGDRCKFAHPAPEPSKTCFECNREGSVSSVCFHCKGLNVETGLCNYFATRPGGGCRDSNCQFVHANDKFVQPCDPSKCKGRKHCRFLHKITI